MEALALMAFMLGPAKPPPPPGISVANTANWPVNQPRTLTVSGRGFTGPGTVITVAFGPDAAVFGNHAFKTVTARTDEKGRFTTTFRAWGQYVDDKGRSWDGLRTPLGVSVAAPDTMIRFMPVSFAPAGPAPSVSTARIADPLLVRGQRARLLIRVASEPVATGGVTVQAGRKRLRNVAEVSLGPEDEGRTSVRLPKSLRGRNKIVFRFRGSENVAASKSNPVWVTVRKHR